MLILGSITLIKWSEIFIGGTFRMVKKILSLSLLMIVSANFEVQAMRMEQILTRSLAAAGTVAGLTSIIAYKNNLRSSYGAASAILAGTVVGIALAKRLMFNSSIAHTNAVLDARRFLDHTQINLLKPVPGDLARIRADAVKAIGDLDAAVEFFKARSLFTRSPQPKINSCTYDGLLKLEKECQESIIGV